MRHLRSQHSGDRKAITKRKEIAVYLALQNANIPFEYQKYIPFAGCDLNSESKCAYLDFVVTKEWGYIILEVNEDQHRSYPVSCDVRRDFDIAAAITLGSEHKLNIIHYNPDSYRIDGNTCVTSPKDRIKKLLEAMAEEPTGFERIFMFYDHETGSSLPQVAASWDAVALQVSRVVQ